MSVIDVIISGILRLHLLQLVQTKIAGPLTGTRRGLDEEMKPKVGVCKECKKDITSFPCTAYGEVESPKEINFNWYHRDCFLKYIERVLIGDIE